MKKKARSRKGLKARATPRNHRRSNYCACDIHVFRYNDKIDDLDLVDYVEEAARTLAEKHAAVVFTSGRRTVSEQASAMAGNVVNNRKWIEQTYEQSAERDSLQKWVDEHPNARTKDQVSTGLSSIMKNWTDDQRKKLSRHFSGQAFDVNPVAGEDGKKIKDSIRNLKYLRKFLDKEGGLVIWHAEFEKA